MKNCLNASTLQDWLDGELSPEATAATRSHLAACAVCAEQVRAAEKTLALIDDAWQTELPAFVPAARLRARIEEGRLMAQPVRADHWWGWQIAVGQWRIGAAIAVLAIAVTAAVIIRSQHEVPPSLDTSARVIVPNAPEVPSAQPAPELTVPALDNRGRKSTTHSEPPARPVQPPVQSGSKRPTPRRPVIDRANRPTWLESETNTHLVQTQLLLRSFRNAEIETVSDVAYERELSRELLNRNRLLRRRAEQKEETRAQELLSHVEPLLLDIANLPERPEPEEMRSLKDLIRDQQIIAELQLYAGKNLF